MTGLNSFPSSKVLLSRFTYQRLVPHTSRTVNRSPAHQSNNTVNLHLFSDHAENGSQVNQTGVENKTFKKEQWVPFFEGVEMWIH